MKTESMFARYSDGAKKAIFYARYWAIQQNSNAIDTGHLLLGVVSHDKQLHSQLLSEEDCKLLCNALIKVDTPELTHEVTYQKKTWVPHWLWRLFAEPDAKTTRLFDVPLSNPSKRVLAYAAQESDKQGTNHTIDCEHLLLGIVIENKDPAASVLQKFNIDLARVREAITAKVQSTLPSS